MATRISAARAKGACDSVVDALDTAGTIEIRSGVQPATVDTADAGSLLATLTLPAPAFGAATTALPSVATANAIATVQGTAAGTAGHFRAKTSTTAVIDGSVTATGGGGDMELNTTTISVGVDVTVTAWTVSMPGG